MRKTTSGTSADFGRLVVFSSQTALYGSRARTSSSLVSASPCSLSFKVINQIAWNKPDPVSNALHTAFTH
ncbi:MAG TPA: hypothetical protein VNA27_05555 [Rubrobacteraceae bacterium]|nr:hypothetical protein [Rubrobacteraceae bacterium]